MKNKNCLEKIDMSFLDTDKGIDDVEYFRVLDGADKEITARIYDDLIPANFAEDEREEKADFQAFYEKDEESDERRENINLAAICNGKFVGFMTGMAFHKSGLGYFDYLATDEEYRSHGIGTKLFSAGKKILKDIAGQHGYDNDELAALLIVEKEDSTMNLDKGQDPKRRLHFYERQGCKKVSGMPCIVPGILDTETGEQKPPLIGVYNWLAAPVNRGFGASEPWISRDRALQLNKDNIDCQYDDEFRRPAEETETYKMIEESIIGDVGLESLFPENTKRKTSVIEPAGRSFDRTNK